jgi:hypothetical protein
MNRRGMLIQFGALALAAVLSLGAGTKTKGGQAVDCCCAKTCGCGDCRGGCCGSSACCGNGCCCESGAEKAAGVKVAPERSCCVSDIK